MNADELDALLDQLEAALAADVDAQLSLVAADFTDAVDGATKLTAASFSVSRIKDMWKARVPRVMDRLKRITRKASDTAAADLEADPLKARELDSALKSYTKATEALLNAVGDRLAAEATQALAEGQAAGEDVSQLKDRLSALFNATGGQLGATRAQRIAATEATRAWNAATLATAQKLTGPDRPLVKQWQTRRDEKVRVAHHDADGQIQLLDDTFSVGDVDMQYPGDPSAPAALTINCRCIMRLQAAPNRQEGADTVTADGGQEDFQSAMPAKLKAYWTTGEGAAKIRWGTPGDFDRCVKELRPKFPQDPKGLCANLHHEALGKWPGQEGLAVNPDGTVHTGAMVALLPSEADMARLALDGGEPAGQLHVTQFYLGDAADWDDDARNQVVASMAYAARVLTPVPARIFGAALWNAASDEPASVWNIGDDNDATGSRLADARYEVQYALEDRHGGPDLPQQHSPWVAHMCAAYGPDRTADMHAAAGPVTLDRLVVAFGGEWTVLPLTGDAAADMQPMPEDDVAQPVDEAFPPVATWSTPGSAALAFENQQTGDGRVFTPGALYWDGPGPWPLQYADAMLGGHDGARLAGAIQTLGRDGGRIPGSGVLYLTQAAGVEAGMLLAQGAPLGVSVDLDDVDMELTSRQPQDAAPAVAVDAGPYRAHLVTASLLPLPDGGFHLVGDTDATATASGVAEASRMSFRVGPDGIVQASAFDIAAAAGDADVTDGTVVDRQQSGDYLMRITRARVRGATLVSIPAYADARIVLDNAPAWLSASFTASAADDHAADATDYDTVVRHVRRSGSPVNAADAAHKLKMSIVTVKRHLAAAARKGHLVKIARGTYVRTNTADTPALRDYTPLLASADSLTASASGAVDLPVADAGTAWDGDGAKRRVLDWADGDCDKAGRAFAYRDDAVDDCTQANAWKLGYADVLDGTLTIIPKGAAAALAAVNGARGGTDLGGDTDAVRNKLEAVRAHVAEANGGDGRNSMEASAWTAMRDMPAMPADWFSDPTDLLPPGGPGVNYANGRIFGWVAQAGEPHAGFAKKITIDGLGNIDTQHFLRQRFTLDDGSVVKAGAFTMNAGHHRDGAECETSACQFDDTRTVAGIVTVGMNSRGMWFSGAAAPWMSDWDRQVFMATQPSYHMKKGPSGNWQLRAVLAVPVPGHSSPLLASAVVARSQEALTAAAMMAEVDDAVKAEQDRQDATAAATATDTVATLDYDRLADALVAAMGRADQKKLDDAAELAALQAEAVDLD